MHKLPDFVACPVCHADLTTDAETLHCTKCSKVYSQKEGYPDLLIGERFNDEYPDWSHEKQTATFLAQHYLAPLLKRQFPGRPPGNIRVLSVGCGIGVDVEVLRQNGFDAQGIDAGNRSRYWKDRDALEPYYLANAKNLPFKNQTFDFVYLCCCLPHVGVHGDSYVTQATYKEERNQVAEEIIRVVNDGGYVMMSGPNRLFPIDFFHRPDPSSHRPRFHVPWENFLLSFKDYQKLLVAQNKCRNIIALPIDNYWGFFRSSSYSLGRLAQIPMKLYFDLISSRLFPYFRRSAINPWLVVLARK